jgi:hypothetical protein
MRDIILEECILCIQYFEKVYLVHTVFWKSIFYACSTLEEYILCMQYFGRVYVMHAVLWKSIFYACSTLEE